MKIAASQVYAYRLPLLRPVTIAGQVMDRREGLAIHLVSACGHEGWGDIAPLPGFSRETFAEARAQALAAARHLLDYGWERFSAQPGVCASVRFGVDSAVLMMSADAHSTSPGLWLGGAYSVVHLNALLFGSTEACVARARDAAPKEFTTFKLKVGRATVADDAERIRRIVEVLPAEAFLRLDANRAWTLAEARSLAARLPEFKPAYVEEPLTDPSQLPDFYAATGWPLALDETLQGRGPQQGAPKIPGVVAWVIKPTLVGRLDDTLAWQDQAYKAKVAAVISASYQSGLGIRMLAELASRNPEVAAGLDTYSNLAQDVLDPRLDFDAGLVELQTARTILVNHAQLRLLA